MVNATPAAARAGFDIFQRLGGDVTIDDLNQMLFDAGYGPIRERTYGHYGKLLRAGLDRYISINRFDLARASGAFENASAQSRYRYTRVAEGVQLVIAKGNQLFEAASTTIEVGETGAVLTLVDQELAESLRGLKPSSGDMVSLRFLESGRVQPGRIVDVDLDSDPILIEVEFTELISLSIVEGGVPRATVASDLVLRAANEDATTTELASRRVYFFFEYLEGIRSIANLVDSRSSSARYSEPAILRSLRIESSPQLALDMSALMATLGPWGLVSGVVSAAAALPLLRKQWLEGAKTTAETRNLDALTEKSEAATRVLLADGVAAAQNARAAAVEADLAELRAKAGAAEAELRTHILERVARQVESQDLDPKLLERVIEAEVLKPLRRLGEARIESIEVIEPEADM